MCFAWLLWRIEKNSAGETSNLLTKWNFSYIYIALGKVRAMETWKQSTLYMCVGSELFLP